MITDEQGGKEREAFRGIEAPRAVVHLGASSASLLVYQAGEDGGIERLEFLEKPLPIGRDIFRLGRIADETLELSVGALRHFQEVLREYGVPASEPERVVATNIIAEAANSDVFLNRLNIGCGLDVEPLDDGEMTRLIFLETQRLLVTHPRLAKKRTLVVHVGPGNTRLLLLEKGRIVQYSNHRLGTHRLGQIEAAEELSGPALKHFLGESMRAKIESIEDEYAGQNAEQMLVIGYEIQSMVRVLEGRKGRMSAESLDQEITELARLGSDERIRRHRADHFSVDALLPAAMINAAIAESLGVSKVFIPNEEYERHLLGHLPFSAAITDSFAREVRQSALSLGRKYRIDVDHGLHVESLCVTLFEALQPLHQLDARHLLLLRVAAITHEVGNFVTPKAHHKHSLYIIANSEIFGLSQADIEFVATIARYHRHSPPKISHEFYADMSRRRRLAVSKLAAILRLADALERAHSNRLQDIDIRLTNRQLRIGTGEVMDLSIENQALEEKGDFFRNVYGLAPVLVPGKA